MNFDLIIKQFTKKRILVIGDVILDQYIHGDVSRISPEAPVPIVLEKKRFYVPGGAANVAYNLADLGTNVTLAGRVGDDLEGRKVKTYINKKNIDTEAIFTDKSVPTILKTRVIANNQQMLRIDREELNLASSQSFIKKLKGFVEKNIKNFDAMILSDYGKGLLTQDMIKFLSDIARQHHCIITVDPKVENFKSYTNMTAITPNLKEAENAIRNIKITDGSNKELNVHIANLETDQDIELAGIELLNYLNLDCLLMTLGHQGMRLFEKGKKTHAINTKAVEVYDVSGAGDAVIAVFTLALISGATKLKAAELSNIAAGIVVGKFSTATVSKNELLKAVK